MLTIDKKSKSENVDSFVDFSYLTNYNENIQQLIKANLIEEKDTPFSFYIDQKPNSEGVANVDWNLPLENKNISLNVFVIKALVTLLKVNFYTKFAGFYPVINLIKRTRKFQVRYTIPSEKELADLANIVNKACLLYPKRTKCLEWAITYVLLALKRKWKCNIEIGVQNYPFFAHAWVECNGLVIMDSQDLRRGLSIILNEPFRKLKI
ncbi:MAG: lasso peptide biosynthesis B2 protein [Alphaproteobacteria bacterium]|nr:lasso peptide biosynthesis B2 protein [Alphaproteobacteria bacterium]